MVSSHRFVASGIAGVFVLILAWNASPVGAEPPQVGQGVALPKAPLKLAQPEPPAKMFEGHDLSEVDPSRLPGVASSLARANRYGDAAQLQAWAVAGNDAGRYNLACWEALAGQKEAAFYWLQEAAIKEGVDFDHALEDDDLKSLRADRRWTQIKAFLKACNAYWSVSGLHQTVLVLPEGYKIGQPIGALVGMHGLGANPGGFVDDMQEYADKLGMAVIGVSGTVPKGPRSFVWAEDAPRDADQIRRALKEVADRVTLEPGNVVTYGFSQGAQMAFEVAFRFPDEFRGAIVMSPGTSKLIDLTGFKATPKNKSQGYVCLCGAGEYPGNIANTRLDAEFAKKAGSRVELQFAEGQNRHTFPAKFAEKFVAWVRFAQQGDGKSPQR